jgi:hypothetical protein
MSPIQMAANVYPSNTYTIIIIATTSTIMALPVSALRVEHDRTLHRCVPSAQHARMHTTL